MSGAHGASWRWNETQNRRQVAARAFPQQQLGHLRMQSMNKTFAFQIKLLIPQQNY